MWEFVIYEKKLAYDFENRIVISCIENNVLITEEMSEIIVVKSKREPFKPHHSTSPHKKH